MTEKKRSDRPNRPDDGQPPTKRAGGTQFAGIVLVAAALFNIPKIALPATTTEERMMLVVLSAMILAGLILLGLPALLKLLNSRRK